MKILYIACEPTLAMNVSVIAFGVKSVHPTAENVLVDPREFLWPDYSAPSIANVVESNWLSYERLTRADYNDLRSYRFPDRAYMFYFRLYQRLKPSVIVVMHEYGYSFYAVQAAKLAGVPSYHVQHAIFDPEHFEMHAKLKTAGSSIRKNLFAQILRQGQKCLAFIGYTIKKSCPCEMIPHGCNLHVEKDERYPLYADRIALWSSYYKRLLLEHRPGFGENKIDVVGFPHADSYFRDGKKSREQLFSEYGFSLLGILAIYLYCPFHEFGQQFEIKVHPDDALLDAVTVLRKIDPDINILILPHPNYSLAITIARLKKLLSHLDNVTIGDNSKHFLALCDHACIVIGVMSSLFYIAFLAEVPVVVQAYVVSDILDYQSIEGAAVIPVFYRSTLFEQIHRALDYAAFLEKLRDNQKMLARKLLGEFDGKSGVRTATAITASLSLTTNERNGNII
jgi:hypothetical protein